MEQQQRSERLVTLRSFYPLAKAPDMKDARYIAFLSLMGTLGIDTRYNLTALKTTGQIGTQKSYEAIRILALLPGQSLILAAWTMDRWYDRIVPFFQTAEGYFPDPLLKAIKIALINEYDWAQAALQFTGGGRNAGPLVLSYREYATGREDGRILVLPFKAGYTDAESRALASFMDRNLTRLDRQAQNSVSRLTAVSQAETQRYRALTEPITLAPPARDGRK